MSDFRVVSLGDKQAESSYTDRMVKEWEGLAEKIQKLVDFLDSEKKAKLNAEELSLMFDQLEGMSMYAAALEARLGLTE